MFFLFPNKVFAADILINEFIPNPGTGNSEWVEFYNTTNSTVNLSDYFFDDDTNFDSDSGSSAKISLSGLLPPLQTCFWEMSSFLNNNGDSPTLFKMGSSTPLDTYTYSSSSAELLPYYVRIPDGGEWNLNQTPSKSSNKCIDSAPTPTPTPTPTPAPTKSPSPTKTPTPTKSPTPASNAANVTPKPSTPAPSISIGGVSLDEEVLGEASESASMSALNNPSAPKNPERKEIVLSSRENNIAKILIALGFVFILACGILFSWPHIRKKIKKDDAR